jgi:hypothetical protein
VTVLNLNAAMGFELKPDNPAGTDATPEDIGRLADDILKHPADVVHLQEMAVNAARDLRTLLSERTPQLAPHRHYNGPGSRFSPAWAKKTSIRSGRCRGGRFLQQALHDHAPTRPRGAR